MSDVRDANQLGVRMVARRPEWATIPVRTDGGGNTSDTGNVTVKDAPTSPTSGISLGGAPKALIDITLREDVARFGTYVRIRTLDPTATYTVTIDGLAHEYDASAGDGAQATIIEGIKNAINAGVSLGSLSLTLANANPDTITRAAGSFVTDGVGANIQITLDGGGLLNDGVRFTAGTTAPTATVFTCIASDAVVAEGPVSYTVTANAQVIATTEDRDGDGVVDTVVIRTLLGEDQDDLSPTDAKLQELARDTTTQTVTVGADGTGALEFDQDATTCDVEVYGYDGGVSNSAKPNRWRNWNAASWTGITYIGKAERLTVGGFSRMDVAVRNADGIVTITGGPAIDE